MVNAMLAELARRLQKLEDAVVMLREEIGLQEAQRA